MLTGPSCDNAEEDTSASARGASATVLEETRKEMAPAQFPVSGPELAAMMKIGTRVMRGVDWKWGDQVLGADSPPQRTAVSCSRPSLRPLSGWSLEQMHP